MPRALKFRFVDNFDHGPTEALGAAEAFGAAEALGVVEVPTGITSKPQLMRELLRAVPLPDYFGGNWDALDECLRERLLADRQRPLCLVHRDLPLAQDARDCRDYLVLLNDTLWWAEASRTKAASVAQHPAARFAVIFPASAARAIEQLVGPTESC